MKFKLFSKGGVLLGLVSVENSFLLAWSIVNCENKLSRFIVPESVANWSSLWTYLLAFLDNYGVRSFITRHKFLFVIYFPTQNSQIPSDCCSNLSSLQNQKEINHLEQLWNQILKQAQWNCCRKEIIPHLQEFQ